MITLPDIANRLKNLHFSGFEGTVRSFLSCFDIAESSITRIVQKLSCDPSKPTFVYRKAVIFCKYEGTEFDDEGVFSQYEIDFPLVLIFSNDKLYYKASNGIPKSEYYGELYLNAEDFLPFIVLDKKKKDAYKTLDFGSCIASLYRALIASNEKKQQDCFNLLFDIIKIFVFATEQNRLEIQSVLNNGTGNCKEKTFALLKLFPLLTETSNSSLVIDKEQFSYLTTLFTFDNSLLDIEMLSSLIYKIFDTEDALLYGPQTSFININKLINPLFVTDYEERIKNESEEELKKTASQLLQIVFIDPTNSPGCFLSAAYSAIYDLLANIDKKLNTRYADGINITNYIALVDNRIAKKLTELVIVYSKISSFETKNIENVVQLFSQAKVLLCNPLEENWENYISKDFDTYLIGSPLFKGYTKLSPLQKKNVNIAYGHEVCGVDYCSAWLSKSASIVGKSKAKAAYVLTNSVVQGEQVSNIWPDVRNKKCEIDFAYTSFKWKTSENTNIGVSVIIVGISQISSNPKRLFFNNQVLHCSSIGPYLIPDTDIIVKGNSKSLFSLPTIRKGNMPYDHNHLLLNTKDELNEILKGHEESKKFIKRVVGSDEFIKNIQRWCIWIPDESSLKNALKSEIIKSRIDKVRDFRKNSTATEKCKATPYKFRECYETHKGHVSLLIPSVSSENRYYIPMGFVNNNFIITNLAFAVYDCDPWILAIVSSKMHMLWIKMVCGALETRYRYSNKLGYNTFPTPPISDADKTLLKMLVFSLISIREKYCDKSLGELYNAMPKDLLDIHRLIDEKIDSLYRKEPFSSDFERIQHLIKMYQKKSVL